MVNDNKTLILGAGLAGLSAAYHLRSNCEIFEQEKQYGGLCRSIETKGYTFDYAGHLLHCKDARTKWLIKYVLKRNILSLKRNSWVFFRNTYTRYPFQMNTYGLPLKIIRECLQGYLSAINSGNAVKPKPQNFFKWVLNNFGQGFVKYFMKPYNEKLFGIELQKMSVDWAERFIPIPRPEDVIKGAISEVRKQIGYNTSFYYPKHGGINALCEGMSRIMNRRIHTGHKVTKIDCRQHQVTFENGSCSKYAKVISTIPLPELIKIITDVPRHIKTRAAKLRYRSVYVLNLGIARENISPKHWIYFPERKYVFYRVGFPSNFSKFNAPEHMSSLSAEISCSSFKQARQHKLQMRTIKDLKKAKILTGRDRIVANNEMFIKYAYVIYDHARDAIVREIMEFLNKNSIHCIGRYGRWEYSTMEDAILQGKQVAQEFKSLMT